MLQALADLAAAYPLIVDGSGIAAVAAVALVQIYRYVKAQEARTGTHP